MSTYLLPDEQAILHAINGYADAAVIRKLLDRLAELRKEIATMHTTRLAITAESKDASERDDGGTERGVVESLLRVGPNDLRTGIQAPTG